MPNFIDYTEHRFGRLFVLSREPSVFRSAMWRCRCDCGTETIVRAGNLRSGNTKSCGCERRPLLGNATRTHGMSGESRREYAAWKAMKTRCSNAKLPGWKDYGGRGIKVCPEWQNDFPAFLAHIGPRPSPAHSVDRIDVDGDYEPGNVRWATPKVQSLNTRPRRVITVNGETMRVRDAAAKFGLKLKTVKHRLWRGCTDEEAVKPSVRGRPHGYRVHS